MLYSLAIVLALAMVLCMIPAAFAQTTTVSNEQYDVTVGVILPGGGVDWDSTKDDVNSYTFEYNYEQIDEVQTSRYEEDAKMAMVQVAGLVGNFTAGMDIEITVDGKKLEVNDYAEYSDIIDGNTNRVINSKAFAFPVELTKEGYTALEAYDGETGLQLALEQDPDTSCWT